LDRSPAPQLPDPVSPEPDRGWLARNGIYLLVGAALLVFLYSKFGLTGLWSIVLVALGLGLVIFIHELGHFAVAKWCDVYVQTFSIGFGPALPGCQCKRGDTVYKISVLPLGGYVQMLGEGTETDEDEDNPRSYKNKSVGQRMMIISAGVIMNVLLACVCFIGLFWGPGMDQISAVVGTTDPGNRAWEKGIPSGAVLTHIGGYSARPGRPLYFSDLTNAVVGSAWGEKLPIGYDVYEPGSDQPRHYETEIEPRKDQHDDRPVIGVGPAESVELERKEARKVRPTPYLADSAAAVARRVPTWQPGDVVVATTDPDHPDAWKDLPAPDSPGAAYSRELARRCYALTGQSMKLRIRRKGSAKVEEVESEAGGFQFGDTIVATTDPDQPDRVTALPPDPRNPGSKLGDNFEYERRLRRLADRVMVIRVRHADQKEEDFLVPPDYHLTLGARMRMGQVAGVRDHSPAAQAGVLKGDFLREILLKDGSGNERRFAIGEGNSAEVVDPLRLPAELRSWADSHRDVKAVLTVTRTNPEQGRERVTKTLPSEVPWDDGYRFDHEMPGGFWAPLAIPELGVAYRVGTVVEAVAKGSPADGRLQQNDIIKAVRYKRLDDKGKLVDGDWQTVEADQWPFWFSVLQGRGGSGPDSREVAFRVERGGKVLDEPVTLTLDRDTDWPQADRGLIHSVDWRLETASGPLQALYMGLEETWNTITNTYRQLRGFVTRRISLSNAGGPIKIGAIAYSAASAGTSKLVWFMGLISINLAVINFLPIPFLDGGHMVFLIYEKIRGRQAPEAVRNWATVAGLVLLATLMITFFYLDISSLFFKH
jgi:regulator of sigma E protease